MIITVVLGLLVLSVLVIIHELGHFWVGRRLGVRIERFSIGFGPVIFSHRDKHDVEWAVSALPLGGYVKFGGDDPRDRSSLKSGDFFAASWWRRVLIALAGPGANFVLAIVLSIALLWIGVRVPDMPSVVGNVTAGSMADSLGIAHGSRLVAVNDVPVSTVNGLSVELEKAPGEAVALTVQDDSGTRELALPAGGTEGFFRGISFLVPAEVGEVVIGTPAYKAGMVVGDRIVAVDGEPVETFNDLVQVVSASPDKELVFTVERGGNRIELPITPFADATQGEPVGRIGITAASTDTYLVRMGFSEGLVTGTQGAVRMVGVMMNGIFSMFSNPSNLSQVSGPVAIIQGSGDAAQAGIDRLLSWAAQISIALMVFNLLPIPILDGGMVVLSLIEGIRRRPLGATGLNVYQGIGMVVMGSLLVFVLINDPLRILQRRLALGRADDLMP